MSSKKVQNSDLKIYLRLITYLKPYKHYLIFAVVGMVLYSAASLAFTEVFKAIGKVFEEENRKYRSIIPFLIVGITLVRSLGSFLSSYFMTKVSQSVILTLRVVVFNHILQLPKAILEQHNSNHLITLITYNIEGVSQAVTGALRDGLRDGIFVIGCVTVLFIKDWRLTLVFVMVAPLIGFVVSKVGKRLRRLNSNAQTSVGSIAQVSGEVFTGLSVVRSFGAEEYERSRFEVASKYNFKQNMKIAVTQAASNPLIQILVSAAVALIIYIGLGVTQMQGALDFLAYLTVVGMIFNPIRTLGNVAPTILKGVAAAETVFKMIDESREKDEGGVCVSRAVGKVEFDSVNFAYSSQTGNALTNFSCKIEPGKVIALVGKSGSGKTTLVNLLPRFYEISSGRILLDDIPVQEYQLVNLRQQIAVVNQQVILFEGTIADNIAYGCKDRVSEADIKRAADLAYATEFIDKLPQGFNTPVGEGGARLSGGQRQRIAIARAILKDAPILILDEATSALDNESERYIQAALEEVMKGRTTFVIAHRLSTIEHADHIIVMEHGRIIEQGAHNELLQKSGPYSKLHSLQFHDVIVES